MEVCTRLHSINNLKLIYFWLMLGYVFAWGTGYLGQLGLGDDSSWDSPRMIRSLDPSKIGEPRLQLFTVFVMCLMRCAVKHVNY